MLQKKKFLIDEDFTVNVVEDKTDEENEVTIEDDECVIDILQDETNPRKRLKHSLLKSILTKQNIQEEEEKKQADKMSLLKKMQEDCLAGILDKPYHCPVCVYKSANISMFVGHIDLHLRGDKHYVCDNCKEFVTFFKNAYSNHFVHCNTSVSLSCPHCPYVTVKRRYLNKHIKKHLNGHDYNCVGCNFTTVNQDTFKFHLMKVHNIGEKKYKCKKCDTEFTLKGNLQKHVKIHNSDKYNCEDCGYVASSSQELTLHLQNHHENSS